MNLFSTQLYAQGVISGVVNTDKNEPLQGVVVQIKNSNVTTTTDSTGAFRINSAARNAVLVFSYVGYTTIEEAIKGRSNINLTLQTAAETLNQVVVVGYGTLDKKEVTSSIAHVSSKDLSVVSGNNPLMSLQGKVANLSISNLGAADPNSNPSIQLRGVSSRSAGLGPLIVINGIPGGNLENVNQNDIASIDVLKDGAASAIYGTRGSNGVIIITTKKGGGQPRLTYNGLFSTDAPSRVLKTLSADEYLKNGGPDFGGKTDWFDEITRDHSFSQKHTVTFSGGDARNNYRGTVDYRKANGVDLRSGREDYGARLSLNHRSKTNLYEISLNVAPRTYKSSFADYGGYNMALALNPTQPVFKLSDPGKYYEVQGSDVSAYNPVERAKTDLNGTEGSFLDWNGSIKLNITPSLNSQVSLSNVNRQNYNYFFRPSSSTSSKFYAGLNYGSRNDTRADQRVFEWVNNYSFSRNNHSIKVLGGYSNQYFQNSGLSAENRGFSTDAFTYNNLGNGTYAQLLGRNDMSTYKNDSKLISFFGRVNYSYHDKYLLSASLRYEGSSKFGAESKWGYFPGASIGWRLNEEGFLKHVSWINDLKIRADYGVTGNQDFDNYLSLALYQGAGFYPYNGTYYQTWGPANNGNENLRWEKAKNFNFGVDFALFNNYVSGNINYYRKKQQDLLGYYNVPIPPNIATQTFSNVGTMQNSGIEVQLSADVIKTKNLNYTISFAGASNNNKFISFSNELYRGQGFIDVVSMPAPGSPGYSMRLQEGQRVGTFFMYQYAGVDANGNFLVESKDGKTIPQASAREEDRRIVGNGLPKYSVSLGNVLTFKNWDVSAFFRGAFGYDIFNVHDFYYGLKSSIAQNNVLTSSFKRNNHISGQNTLAFLNSYFLENGNFVKLDVVTIGYKLNSHIKDLEGARVFLSTRNLATFTKFSGVDPEAYPVNGLYPGILTNSDGTGSKSYYPSTRQFTIGVQLDL